MKTAPTTGNHGSAVWLIHVRDGTIGSKFVTGSGQEQTATELFHTDGKEHPGTLSPGVVQAAKWVNSRTIETSAKKKGRTLV